MTETELTMGDWMGVLEAGFASLATGTLGLPAPVAGPRAQATPVGSCGAYLPLLGPGSAYQIALVSSLEGCEMVARGLLGSGPGEPLTAAETADAVCEVVNILAGAGQGQAARPHRPAARAAHVLQRGRPADRTHGGVQRRLRAGSLSAALVLVYPRT